MGASTTSSARVLVLHGPNLNLLGEREPEIYGSTTLAELDARLVSLGDQLGLQVDCSQSNHEGALVDRLQGARSTHSAIIFNPAAYTHTSLALQDAIRAIDPPVFEVHLSNIHAREAARQRSLTASASAGLISGLGPLGYELALRAAAAHIASRSTPA